MKEGLMSFRRDDAVSKFLPFSYHLTESIISLKSTEFMTVIKVNGRPHQTTDSEDIFRWIENLNTMSRTMSNQFVEYLSYVVRRDKSMYPSGEYEGYFAKALNEKYKEGFLDTTDEALKINELYIAIIYRPFGNNILSNFKKKALSGFESIKAFQEECIKELESLTDKMCSALDSYQCSVLTTYTQHVPGSDREIVFSQPMELMSYILNGSVSQVPLTNRRFASTLPQVRMKFSKRGELAVRKRNDITEYVGMCEIADYEKHTWPGQIDYLLESDFSFVMTNSFTCVSDRAAEGFMKNHIKFMKESGDVGKTQIAKMEDALDSLKSGNFSMGMHHCTVMVSSTDYKVVKSRIDSITNDLSKHGIIMKQLVKNLEAGFWAQFPSNRRYRARPKPITSYNFWCFSSFHNFLTGKIDGNPWGNAITAFKTDSKTPFYLSLHDTPLTQNSFGKRPPGHTGIFGKTGAGKTALLNFMLSMMTKYGTKGVFFDKDRGMENFIRAVGGVYNPVLWGEPTGWNPFQLEPTLTNIQFLKEWVAELATNGTGRTLNETDIEEISTAVEGVMLKAEKPRRSLNTLMQILPPGDENRVTVAKLLNQWVYGDLKWVFNNPTDNLSLGEGYYGFDTTSFLGKKQVRIPILKYLTHRADEMVDGSPFILGFEECWHFCEDEFFIGLIKDKLKTLRKLNGIVVFSTQEPNDVLGSAIGKTFAASLSTVLALRNDRANAEDYKKLNLTDVEINLIKGMQDNDRRFIIKQGNVSAVARFDLPNYRDEMEILSGSEDTAIILNECINEHGNDPKVWLPIFYQRMRVEKK